MTSAQPASEPEINVAPELQPLCEPVIEVEVEIESGTVDEGQAEAI